MLVYRRSRCPSFADLKTNNLIALVTPVLTTRWWDRWRSRRPQPHKMILRLSPYPMSIYNYNIYIYIYYIYIIYIYYIYYILYILYYIYILYILSYPIQWMRCCPIFWAQLNFKDTTLASADRTPCRGCRSLTQVKASGSVGGSKNGGTPKWMVSSLKSTKMDDLGVPAFYEPPSRIKFDQQKLQCGPKWIGNSKYSRHKMGCLVAIFVFAGASFRHSFPPPPSNSQ